MPGHPVQSVTDVCGTVAGGDGDREQSIHKLIGPGIGLAMGIGEEGHIGTNIFFNQIYAVLDVGEHPGFICFLSLVGETANAPGLGTVGVVGVGTKFDQPRGGLPFLSR